MELNPNNDANLQPLVDNIVAYIGLSLFVDGWLNWVPVGRRDVQFVSLQHDDDGRQAQQLAELAGTPVHLFAGSLADMDESAALITALDLVITACSAVVHLTGALGARAWVLTPRVAEWRYLNRGEAMPWYPSVRLFRQARLGDWRPVIREVNEKLEALAACRT